MEKKCQGTVAGSSACRHNAKVKREGKLFCGTHDPERLKSIRERWRIHFDEEQKERGIMHEAEMKVYELGRKVPEIATQYAIIDAARERLNSAFKARKGVR